MVLKKMPATASRSYTRVVPIHGISNELDGLYARRSAIEAVIASLEEYDRLRARRVDLSRQKTA